MIPFVLLAAVLPALASRPTLADALHHAIGDCSMPSDGAVLICGHRDSPYRLPPALRDQGFDVDGPVDSVSRERHKLMEAGASGTGSCTNVGAGGWTGCMVQGWRKDEQQRGFRTPGEVPK